MNASAAIADKFVSLWNESDAQRRRIAMADLWAVDAVHRTPSMEACGHDAIEARITTAYEKWVRDLNYRFVMTEQVSAHHDAVRLRWAMRREEDGATLSVGSDFLLLNDAGQIRFDYQFIESS
jgi:nuclear transport factor 2 (NTF2) superfamily protein